MTRTYCFDEEEEEQHSPCFGDKSRIWRVFAWHLCKADTHNSRNVGLGWKICVALFSIRRKLHGFGVRMTRTIRGSPVERYWKINMAPSTRTTREKFFFFFHNENTSGHDRRHRALWPIRLLWGARRPELVQPAGAIEALYEHSGVHAATIGQFCFFGSAEPVSSWLVTSVRFHFHFHLQAGHQAQRGGVRHILGSMVRMALSWVARPRSVDSALKKWK